MTVRLTWVDRDRRGTELGRHEELIHGESEKNPTRKYVGLLIARHHPELKSVTYTHPIDGDGAFRWYVRCIQRGEHTWAYVYADPVDS